MQVRHRHAGVSHFPLNEAFKLNRQSTNDHDEYFLIFGRAAAGLGIDSSSPRHVSLSDLN